MLRKAAVRTANPSSLSSQRLLFSTSSHIRKSTDPTSNPSSSSSSSNSRSTNPPEDQGEKSTTQKGQKKTMAQLDEELRERLESMSGDGGASGIELENGKPVAMKRGVRDNMFRLI